MTTETPVAPGRRFFANAALLMGLIVVASFPLTYFGPMLTGARKFHLLHHVHGLAFFAWTGLYVWQSQLVAAGKVARHREIGLLGFALTGAMLPLGYWMAQRAAEIRQAAGAAHPFEYTWFNVSDLSLFAGLMAASMLTVTRHREWHRRLTFAAALCLVAPAATRWTLRIPGVDALALDVFSYVFVYPFLIALALHDRRALGRLHPATLTIIGLLIPIQIAGAWIARSDWWNALAPGLIAAP